MNDELVQQIAKGMAVIVLEEHQKIADAWKDNPDRIPGRALLSVGQAQAREIVRLMEWAFRDGYSYSSCAHDPAAIGPTLPPDDWTP